MSEISRVINERKLIMNQLEKGKQLNRLGRGAKTTMQMIGANMGAVDDQAKFGRSVQAPEVLYDIVDSGIRRLKNRKKKGVKKSSSDESKLNREMGKLGYKASIRSLGRFAVISSDGGLYNVDEHEEELEAAAGDALDDMEMMFINLKVILKRFRLVRVSLINRHFKEINYEYYHTLTSSQRKTMKDLVLFNKISNVVVQNSSGDDKRMARWFLG